MRYDICVYEATSIGVVAAIEAARLGLSVALISTDGHIGGMTTGGLSATDMNAHWMIGGIAREFYGHIYDYYKDPMAWVEESRQEYFRRLKDRVYGGVSEKERIQWVFEPKVATSILTKMLQEHSDQIRLYSPVLAIAAGGTERADTDLRSLTFADGTKVNARVFLDTSYEGDLIAASGVAFSIGREGQGRYQESLAGFRRYPQRGFIDPYREAGRSNSGLLPLVRPRPATEGSGDDRIQSYCYRPCLTDVVSNQRAFRPPKGIDPSYFEMILRRVEAEPDLAAGNLMTFTAMPNRKTDTNGINLAGLSSDYIKSSFDRRNSIKTTFREYTHGVLWHLTHNDRVPEHIRAEMAKWAFAKDEFVRNENFPTQLYVREGRRLGATAVLTETTARGTHPTHSNEVGRASYAFDSHIVSHFVDENGTLAREGHFYERQKGFPIPLSALAPERNEIENLLSPIAVSASHVAYGSIRMEPTMMCLGQAAANAAALCIEQRSSAGGVSQRHLRTQLESRGLRLGEAGRKWTRNSIIVRFRRLLGL